MSGGHAHYVIVDGRDHRVWSRDKGAHTLLRDLLQGPERTTAFIHEQKGGTADFWMNSVWWSGLALLDVRRRLLLVHALGDLPGYKPTTSVQEIRAWRQLAEEAWPRWRVAWAARELFEVMDHLDLPYDTVNYLDEPPHEFPDQWASPPTDEDDPSDSPWTLIAVRDADRTSFCGSWILPLADPLLNGPAKLLTPQVEATPQAVLETVPRNGVLIDAPRRRLDWWALDLPLDLRRLNEAWPGWTLTGHGDAYEEVTALMGPGLLLEPTPQDEVLHRVRAALAR